MTVPIGHGPDAFGNALRHVRRTYLLSQRALADPARRPAQPHLPARGRPPRHHARVRDLALPRARLQHRPAHLFPCPESDEVKPRCHDWEDDGAVGLVDAALRAFPAHGAVWARRPDVVGCAPRLGSVGPGGPLVVPQTTGRRRCWRHGRMAACPTAMAQARPTRDRVEPASCGGLRRRAPRGRGRDGALRRHGDGPARRRRASTTSASAAAPSPSRRSRRRRSAAMTAACSFPTR